MKATREQIRELSELTRAAGLDKETALNKERRKIQEDEERLEAMNEVFPEATAVREELDRYEAKLKSIEEKFIVQF